MRPLLLAELHAARGAVLGEADGAVVVVSYGDPAGEARAARASAVVADRSHRGRLAVTGADRVSFLQGVSSNDVARLGPGAGHYTTFLSGKGKMRGDAVVQAFDDHLALGVEAGARAVIRAHLESFVILEDVRIEDRTGSMVALGVHGPEARAVLEAAGLAPPADLPVHHFVRRPFAGGEVVVSPERPTGEEGYELRVSPELGPELFAVLATRARPAGTEALETLRIEAGIARFGRDLDGDTIPIEAGLFHAIHYDKGCFTGQEVIARLKNYGHVNRNLVGVALDGSLPAAPGDAVIAAGKGVGAITSACVSPHLGHAISLAMLRREVAAPGTAVVVRSAAGERAGTVTALPFVRRNG